MNSPRIVCPNNPKLLANFSGREVAVKVASLPEVPEAAEAVCNSGNRLHCVIVECDVPLGQLQWTPGDCHIPLAVFVPSVGKVRDIVHRLETLRKSNVRVYVPCDSVANLVAIRILSSLGIETCAVFDGTTNWDALADLMIYAVLEHRTPHADIQPFAYMVSAFDPASRSVEWSFQFFDDPACFVHLDADGRVALSADELKQLQFVATNLNEFDAIAESLLARRAAGWKQFFLAGHSCTACPGWRLCGGRYAASVQSNPGCQAFFSEMMEAARQHREASKPPEVLRVWRP